jgi:sugar/nucleoside kinase (ribokinase family)
MRMPPKVASIGNFTIDRVQTPTARSADVELGGDCVYAAVGAHVWGATVEVVSVVGADYPQQWLAELRAHGIGTGMLRHTSEAHALVAPMSYDELGRRENEAAPSEPSQRPPQAMERWLAFSPDVDDFSQSLGWADCVHLASMPVERQNRFLRLFAGQVQVITLDVPWAPGISARGELPEIGLASAVLLSDAEVRGHFGDRPVESVAQSLFDCGARIVAIKQGSRGSLVFEAATSAGRRVPPYPAAVLDPTGAGDAYCGGFAVGLWESGDATTAGRYGTVAAAYVIEGFGADYALGFRREAAESRLDNLHALLPHSGLGGPGSH